MLNVCDSLRDNSIRNRNVQFGRVFYVIDGYIYFLNIRNLQYILNAVTQQENMCKCIM